MALKICTACGYEGKAIKPPSDIVGEEDNETKKAFDKLCRGIFLATGIPVKPLAMALVLPVYAVLWPLKGLLGASTGPKYCPNCSLPTMVDPKSDAGWLAKRKNDIKSGAWVPPSKRREEEVLEAAPPKPEKLPSLDEILKPAAPTAAAPEPEAPAEVKKRPVDPDQW